MRHEQLVAKIAAMLLQSYLPSVEPDEVTETDRRRIRMAVTYARLIVEEAEAS
jgi:predicted Rossmann fold nucleotide-binding protein DprA/Smf involved in DNA uptake